MKLVTIDCVAGGRPGAWLRNGEILHLEKAAMPGTAETWLPQTMRALLTAGDEGLALARRIVERAEAASPGERERLARAGALSWQASTRLLAPVPDPAMILSAGQAYRSHLAEMKTEPPKEPHGFIKATSSVVGPGADVPLPPQCDTMVDFEGELCAVIGRVCHNVSVGEALDYVAGYTITNDVSARDWVPLIGKARTTPEARTAWDLNHMGKQLPAFSPLGPVIATRDEIGDPGNLDLTTRLNGAVMQRANTSDLIFTVAQTIAHFSHWYTFLPGDIISTGTPAGVGYGRNPKVFLKPGDVVEVEVSRIGVLSNRFVAGAAASAAR
jgi:2-keto-4-pentenoate hydratase/2-oxohepta-3-ene-1,7-dioic acid hydratase in catechol pathway